MGVVEWLIAAIGNEVSNVTQ